MGLTRIVQFCSKSLAAVPWCLQRSFSREETVATRRPPYYNPCVWLVSDCCCSRYVMNRAPATQVHVWEAISQDTQQSHTPAQSYLNARRYLRTAPQRVKYSSINIACNSACKQLQPFVFKCLLVYSLGRVTGRNHAARRRN